MRWAEYKQLCNRPDYQSRWMIEQTLELADHIGLEMIREQLASVLGTQPLEAPSDHKGGSTSEMYKLDLCCETRRQICELVVLAKVKNIKSALTLERGLSGFEEAWTEYYNYSG